MANQEHLRRLKGGINGWNAWRSEAGENPDLSGVDLNFADLNGANLSYVDFSGAELVHANLDKANLFRANLRDANLQAVELRQANLKRAILSRANLGQGQLVEAILDDATLAHAILQKTDLTSASLQRADLSNCIVSSTDLTGANLTAAILSRARLFGTLLNNANLSKVLLYETFFADCDLSSVIGLDTCRHRGRSSVDHGTLYRSGSLPRTFLRGVGMPDMMIDYLPSLLNQAIQHYSCFISYSTEDQDFADRLHADLQDKGVRCWFAPHDMPIGGKILDEIDAAIRLRDKVLLILSEHSIKSDWVEDEVTRAFEEERRRGQIVLFPIRLDDAIMGTNEAWAGKLRARHIGDFRPWKNHDAYKKSFERVLRDLKLRESDSQQA